MFDFWPKLIFWSWSDVYFGDINLILAPTYWYNIPQNPSSIVSTEPVFFSRWNASSDSSFEIWRYVVNTYANDNTLFYYSAKAAEIQLNGSGTYTWAALS